MKSPAPIALVTGAGTGVGKAAALALAKAGYRVVLAGRRKALLDEVVKAIGSRAFAVPSDLTEPASVAALFAAVKARYGRLDVLFNNAGVIAPAIPIEDLAFEQWRSVIDTNVTGAFLCTQHAFRLMKSQKPQGGRIINNGSVSATTPRPNTAPYTASKHAITGLTKSTALDGRRFNIACSQIDIGNAATETASKILNGMIQPDLTIKHEATFNVKHVADLIVYMARLPLDANVQFVTLMATKMPLMGRG